MRIALVHYTFPPIIGGVERVASEHATLMAAAGHEVTVISGNVPNSKDAVRTIEIPLIAGTHPAIIAAQDELRSGIPKAAFARATEELDNALSQALAGQDVVIVHNVCTMPFNLPLTAALAGMPVKFPGTRFVSWIHDIAAINPDYAIPPGQPWSLLRHHWKGFECVVVSELRQTQWCELTGTRADECPVIPNGFNPVTELGLSPLAAALVGRGLLERELVLLHPCRLLRRKNVEFSLQVTKALRDAGHDTALLLTGAADPHHAPSAEYAAEIVTLRDELGLRDEVLFLGDICQVEDSDMPSLYQVADALLLPSRQEGFGLPVLEAAVHRIPAFCSDIEPLRALPGAIPFSLKLSAKEVASIIIHRMEGWAANSPRKSAVRHYAWRSIYRTHLDPFLRRTNNHPS